MLLTLLSQIKHIPFGTPFLYVSRAQFSSQSTDFKTLIKRQQFKSRYLTKLLEMRKYTMLSVAGINLGINLYGIVISFIFTPIAPVVLASALLMASVVLYIQFGKKRVLIDGREKESFFMFGLLILSVIYFAITSLALMVYLSMVQEEKVSDRPGIQNMLVGANTLGIIEIENLNLPYYCGNFLSLMGYIRCFYVMFWRDNIVFIYRYLKRQVNLLNQTLLAHLPKVPMTPELKETICSLCLEEYKNDENITRLFCKHYFHLDCIKVWVMRSNCCPLCRHKVVF